MTSSPARLRMFAGPNGSGKTTVKNDLHRPPAWFGIYINPDELENTIRETGLLPLESLELTITTQEIQHFFASSLFLRGLQLHTAASAVECRGGVLDFRGMLFNSYHASVLADFLRRKALELGRSFTTETVMSSRDKIDLLGEARARGFRTYLYYVATEDPAINIQRVKNRVVEGGHDVPEAKIVSRYHRSLRLLHEAIRTTSRSFLFDTSEEAPWYFAEATEGIRLDLKSDEMPQWFEPIWNQFGLEGRSTS